RPSSCAAPSSGCCARSGRGRAATRASGSLYASWPREDTTRQDPPTRPPAARYYLPTDAICTFTTFHTEEASDEPPRPMRRRAGPLMAPTRGFIGLGVMGEAMCRNPAKKSGAAIVAFDTRPAPLAALSADGVETAASVDDVARRADVIFLCLPGEPQVRG